MNGRLALPWSGHLPWLAPREEVQRKQREAERRASGLVWIFARSGPDTPDWIIGYQYPITVADAEALVGTEVTVRFEYQYDEFPDGRTTNYAPRMITITDKNSPLEVHERTFDLAADAFIVAAKRMRLDR